MGLVDLHVHLLPGVDDGPPTLDDSLVHAARVADAGVTEVVVTPHVGHSVFPLIPSEIPERTKRLERALAAEGIGLRLRPGGEIHSSAAQRLRRHDLGVVAQGPAGRRWLLLEAPFAGIDPDFVESCRWLRLQGFAVVIAHPERSKGLLSDGIGHLRGELACGSLLQVSVCSLLGRHGDEVQVAAETLVTRGLAAVVASDGHGARRNQTLRQGLEALLELGVGAERAWQLVSENPRALLQAGLPVLPEAPGPPARNRAAADPRPQAAHRFLL